MSKLLPIRVLCLCFMLNSAWYDVVAAKLDIPFLGNTYSYQVDDNLLVPFGKSIHDSSIAHFSEQIQMSDYHTLTKNLLELKKSKSLNDWLFYQLIRNTAQQLSPKSENYYRYTLYKWFLLNASGYQATLSIHDNCLLFYVWTDENVYGMPFFERDKKQFVCINYHDYGHINFKRSKPVEISSRFDNGYLPFSYKVTQIPELNANDYTTKDIQFNYKDKVYTFSIKLNPQVKALFKNYPVPDFETYFNIPLSHETYNSFIPALKQNTASLSEAEGIDYLMRFTRNAFLYETDQKQFGQEKRLTPEQTLLYEHSDCDDRAGLFFYLVKEIYNKPMIVLLYPTHVTVAIQLENPIGQPIFYNGKAYTVCEPTPQQGDLPVGTLAAHLRKKSYEIVYVHNPQK